MHHPDGLKKSILYKIQPHDDSKQNALGQKTRKKWLRKSVVVLQEMQQQKKPELRHKKNISPIFFNQFFKKLNNELFANSTASH